MNLRFFRSTLITAALAATLSSASAVVLPYDVAGGSVLANTGNGLIINYSLAPNLSNVAFNLNDGQSITFPFFNIWTPEGSIEPDDLLHLPISATLNFTIPLIGANVSGVTFGGSIILVQWGQVQWNGPVVVNAGDRTFQVSLSDEYFNGGAFALGEQGATICATVTQISSTLGGTPGVPDGGSTSVLLGIGMLGLVAGCRRFHRVKA